MAWNDSDSLVVASNGQVYVGAVGATLPTTPDSTLSAADWKGLGYVTEDGVSLSVSPNIEEFMAWQSRQPVRRELTAQEVQVSFSLEQWNEDTLPFAFGGDITDLGGGDYRFDLLADGDPIDERALIIDAVDGSKNYRWVFPKGNVTDAVETTFQRSSLSVLPVTFKALQGDTERAAYMLTNDPAFATGS